MPACHGIGGAGARAQAEGARGSPRIRSVWRPSGRCNPRSENAAADLRSKRSKGRASGTTRRLVIRVTPIHLRGRAGAPAARPGRTGVANAGARVRQLADAPGSPVARGHWARCSRLPPWTAAVVPPAAWAGYRRLIAAWLVFARMGTRIATAEGVPKVAGTALRVAGTAPRVAGTAHKTAVATDPATTAPAARASTHVGGPRAPPAGTHRTPAGRRA